MEKETKTYKIRAYQYLRRSLRISSCTDEKEAIAYEEEMFPQYPKMDEINRVAGLNHVELFREGKQTFQPDINPAYYITNGSRSVAYLDTLSRVLEVEAGSETEALEKAQSWLDTGKVKLQIKDRVQQTAIHIPSGVEFDLETADRIVRDNEYRANPWVMEHIGNRVAQDMKNKYGLTYDGVQRLSAWRIAVARELRLRLFARGEVEANEATIEVRYPKAEKSQFDIRKEFRNFINDYHLEYYLHENGENLEIDIHQDTPQCEVIELLDSLDQKEGITWKVSEKKERMPIVVIRTHENTVPGYLDKYREQPVSLLHERMYQYGILNDNGKLRLTKDHIFGAVSLLYTFFPINQPEGAEILAVENYKQKEAYSVKQETMMGGPLRWILSEDGQPLISHVMSQREQNIYEHQCKWNYSEQERRDISSAWTLRMFADSVPLLDEELQTNLSIKR